MNQIAEKQNEDRFIEYLAAQRQLYNEAKGWDGFLLILPVVFAILGNITLLTISWTFIPPLLTWLAWLYAISELFFFSYVTSKKREQAAKTQELFDCELLELPWNDIFGEKPKPTEIYKAFQRFQKQNSHSEFEKLKNWYTTSLFDENTPLPIARVACQKQNIWWDSEQRRAYAKVIIIITTVLFLAFITVGVIANWSFQQFLQGPLALSLTVLVVGLKHGFDHNQAAKRLDELENNANFLLKLASSGIDETLMLQKSRDLQNEIFHHRCENPSVFNWFYKMVRELLDKISKNQRR